MKQLIKLKDLTPEQWDKHRNALCNIDKRESCDGCIFQGVNCSDSLFRNSWINNKEKYNADFLNQEVELHFILEEKEKEYLKAVIAPFRDRVVSIKKVGCMNNIYFISIKINSKVLDSEEEYLSLPFFQDKMYQGMKSDKEYTLEELGL